ncbi:hypothetical protein SKAU_G00332820 [Synaphobranchus kaupii]|uniref:Uncharacterized protein n=1 Tax=Synaphobranchus kaupii TaxID=118154 RepID=A0A9Q1ELE0_SYNKA|nr:hypothetical protein SKAU_G00332820 [Synaphobranchus kaupii]
MAVSLNSERYDLYLEASSTAHGAEHLVLLSVSLCLQVYGPSLLLLLFFIMEIPCLSAEGTARPGPAGHAPQGFWNFTWTAEDELSFPEEVTSSESGCHGNRELCDRPSQNRWSLGIPEGPWEARPDRAKSGTRLQNWEEGE